MHNKKWVELEEVITLNKIRLTLKKHHMLSLRECCLEKEETVEESGLQQFLVWVLKM